MSRAWTARRAWCQRPLLDLLHPRRRGNRWPEEAMMKHRYRELDVMTTQNRNAQAFSVVCNEMTYACSCRSCSHLMPSQGSTEFPLIIVVAAVAGGLVLVLIIVFILLRRRGSPNKVSSPASCLRAQSATITLMSGGISWCVLRLSGGHGARQRCQWRSIRNSAQVCTIG